MRFLFLILTLAYTLNSFADEALQPPKGWNTWNVFKADINEQLIKHTADELVAKGLSAAGYHYLVIDDGWSLKQRDSQTHQLVPDPKKFPNGIKALSDYVHSKGLKLGIYTDAGVKTCLGHDASKGYEQQDMALFASWDIDFVKIDWCYSDVKQDAKASYKKFYHAEQALSKSITLSFCNWGQQSPWLWAPEMATMWRTTFDIRKSWQSMWSNYDQQSKLQAYQQRGHYNDPDMLILGNHVLNPEQERTHFILWVMASAPLILSGELTEMTKADLALVTNKELLAIHADALAYQADLVQQFNHDEASTGQEEIVDIWRKKMANGEQIIAVVNRSGRPYEMSWRQEWVVALPIRNHKITDVFSGQEFANAESLKYVLKPYETRLFRL